MGSAIRLRMALSLGFWRGTTLGQYKHRVQSIALQLAVTKIDTLYIYDAARRSLRRVLEIPNQFDDLGAFIVTGVPRSHRLLPVDPDRVEDPHLQNISRENAAGCEVDRRYGNAAAQAG